MQQTSATYPTYGEFYDTWYLENEVRWTKSSAKAVRHNVSRYSMPVFRDTPIDKISRSDLLAFRADLSKGRVGLHAIKNVTVNKIMSPMRQILDEAAYRFDYPSPFINIMITVSPSAISPVISTLSTSGMSIVIAGQPISGIGS